MVAVLTYIKPFIPLEAQPHDAYSVLTEYYGGNRIGQFRTTIGSALPRPLNFGHSGQILSCAPAAPGK